jgi:hypothetical protein
VPLPSSELFTRRSPWSRFFPDIPEPLSGARHLRKCRVDRRWPKDSYDGKTTRLTGKPPDAFSDSFYYRAIRTKIGEALRTELVPMEPPSERILRALRALDDQPADGATEEKKDSVTQGSSKTKSDK